MPMLVASRSKTWVYGRSQAAIAGSNPNGGMDVCLFYTAGGMDVYLVSVVCLKSVIVKPRQ
jgi:hypothetical protein